MSERPKIVVVGSVNVDQTFRVPRFPAPGETITALGRMAYYGGKGANQAVAAARAGGEVTLIGRMGPDDYGTHYLEYLRTQNVRAEITVKPGPPTGSAFIAVDDRGENTIIYHPGANHALEPQDIDARAEIIRSTGTLLVQLECPLPAILRAIAIATESGVPVIINASPLTPEFLQSPPVCDTLIVNEHEAVDLTGMTIAELQASPQHALAKGQARQVIVTRGGESTLVFSAGQISSINPPKVDPVNTVGAGDAFAGAFAVCLAAGTPVEEAVRFANAAGALTTLSPGTQGSMPTGHQIRDFLARQG